MLRPGKLSRAVGRAQRARREWVNFAGGLDLVTPPYKADPGTCRLSENWELDINGGYATIRGYERYDGQAKPSAAQYGILPVTISGSIIAGDTITGADSGSTAVVVAVASDSSYLVITKISAAFNASENLEVSAVVEGVTTSTYSISGATTTLLNAQYKNLAADSYRADIAAVPGSGDILGVWMLNDVVYAFRNNVAATEAKLYKSTAAGWTAVALGYELEFTSGGTYEIQEGDVITGATSTETATVTRVVLESGSWAAGTAAGRLVFASQSGAFQAENLNVGANTNVATIAGDSSAITLTPSGAYKFVTNNFGGQSGTKRMYGCDSVNYGFEFDGTVFVQIHTGMTTDAPSNVIVHKQHLFYSFAGSLQHSGITTPYIWSVVFGAAELVMGDDITALAAETGADGSAALGVYSKNIIHILYGTSSSDWNIVRYRDEIGARENSVQQIGRSIRCDDRGIADLQTSQNYGNFAANTLSWRIQPWINAKKDKITASCKSRDKSQYRLFFSDKYALYATFRGDELMGMMPMLLNHKVVCMFSLEDSAGAEVIMFGSDDGYVYQMEKGTSFDGDAIETYMYMHYWHLNTPMIDKHFKGCSVEMTGTGYVAMLFSYEIDYTGSLKAQSTYQASQTAGFSPAYWDLFTWDAFYWDGQNARPAQFKMSGHAENVSLIFRTSSDYYDPVTVSGAILRYTMGRELLS